MIGAAMDNAHDGSLTGGPSGGPGSRSMTPAADDTGGTCAGMSRVTVRAFMLSKMAGHLLSILLVGVLGALLWGHVGGASMGLSLLHSYVTEYGFAAPHWPWIIIATFGFAAVLFLLVVRLMLQLEPTPCLTIGCALVAASSMALFFVSYAPMRRAEQPGKTLHVRWTPHWWSESRTARSAYDQGLADAYSDVHYHAIRLFTINALLGQVFLALGLLASPRLKGFAVFTLATAAVMSVFFILGDHGEELRGLWQRLGFLFMYVWIWAARFHVASHACCAPARSHQHCAS